MSHSDDEHAAVRKVQIKNAALAHVAAAFREAEVSNQNLHEMIRAARAFGATWADLGTVMSMSRQTAHKRFNGYTD